MSETPFDRLARLEALGRDHRAVLPAQEKVREEWAGVGFRIGGRHFVAAMDEVREILTYPRVSRVPHASHWVRGVANVRGNLLPIMDLSGYLERGPVNLSRIARVLVIEHDGVLAGLLVDEVLGMRRFLRERWQRVAGASEEAAVRPYLEGVFEHEGGLWPVFSMVALSRHPRFLKVAE